MEERRRLVHESQTRPQPHRQVYAQLSLSKRHTGHRLRVTTTQNLCNAFIPNQHVTKITGHRKERPLKSYNSRSTQGQKALMSNLLDNPIDDTATILQPPRPFALPPPQPRRALRKDASSLQAAAESTSTSHDEEWDTAMVQAVTNVMNRVERRQTRLESINTRTTSVFGEGAVFNNCHFHF